VGIWPARDRLCTDAARRLIDWALDRSAAGYEPDFVASVWRV
jgi:hypothetical protein